MRIGKVKLVPLESKHYSTEIEVEVGGNDWDKVGTNFKITIAGYGSKPSMREYEKGCYSLQLIGEGMDHVESEEHYQLASIILEALTKHKEN